MREVYMVGKNIDLYLVEIEDADFILNLRSKRGKYLTQIDCENVNRQKEWIKGYKKKRENKRRILFFDYKLRVKKS